METDTSSVSLLAQVNCGAGGQDVVVLNERRSVDGRVVWQARISDDRGRLEVVAIVAPSTEPTVVEPLTDAELRELLAPRPVEGPRTWSCSECGYTNDRARRWCSACSSHVGGAR